MTTMQRIAVLLLLAVFSAVNTRTIHGAAIDCGTETLANSKPKGPNARGMTLAQLDDLREQDISSTMFRAFGVLYELQELENDALEAVRKELAALENEPGIYKKRRLQDKQKRLALEIAATEMVMERLAMKMVSIMWRRLCSRILRFFSLS
jgi:hypothetical protein